MPYWIDLPKRPSLRPCRETRFHQPQTLKWLARKATRSQRQACAATPGSSLMTRAPARHTTRRSCTLEICTTYSASLPESPRSCLTQNIGSAPEKAEADAVSEDLERGNRVVRRRPGPRSRALSHGSRLRRLGEHLKCTLASLSPKSSFRNFELTLPLAHS
jgi:hypothetical protein